MKTVLLTGATGFIGHHCVEPLLVRGYDVHAVSSRAQSGSGSPVHWHQANLLDKDDVRSLVSRVQATHLLHLAWYVVPGKLIAAPENFSWVSSSLELVQRFVDQGGNRLVVSGSAYEYDWRYGYYSEHLTRAEPNTVYGSCKRALQLLVESLAMPAEVSAAWGRVFFLYGPREHPDRLVSSVIRSLLAGQPASCSHGRQIRDYLHVQDVADGLVGLLDSNVEGAINVSSGQATTLRDIILTIGSLLDARDLIKLGALPARPNDTPLVVGDNTRMLTEVGWTQTFNLEDGLRQTIEWWRSQESRETV